MSANESSAIVGIDLGTTNSVVAGVIDGKVEVLIDEGEAILPSVVGLDAQGKLITGKTAQNQLAAFPDRTIASVKRKMGSSETITLADQTFTPQEISAMILRRLVDRATRKLGVPVERAVITVPAFFDENQRQATREAGTLAGLTVERIINEPTAATLVYHAGTQQKKHIVVYDFGGGTFDVSVVRFEMGVVEVLSSKGDTLLGGDDFDELLLDHIADGVLQEHGVDLRKQASTRYRMLQVCEVAKRKLSESASVEIHEEFVVQVQGTPVNVNCSLSRHEFEQMIAPLVDQTIESVTAAIRDTELKLSDIDDLVLVGGSTRIPMVERRLAEELGLTPSRAVDPDLAVALGAATQAAMLAGLSVGPVLVDITGHTLGVVVVEDFNGFTPKLGFSPIIHRNSPLPAAFEEVYSRMHEEQLQVAIQVLQGESNEISRNRPVGEITLELDTGDDASDDIVVRFELTLDGTLTVTATQTGTDNSRELVIDNALSEFKQDSRDHAVKRLTKLFGSSNEMLDTPALPAPSSQSSSNNYATKKTNTAGFPAAEALLAKSRSLENIPAEDVADLERVTKELHSAMAGKEPVQVAALCEELEDILFYYEG